MAGAVIYYLLTKAGQKDNLKKDNNGNMLQKVTGEVENEDIDLFNITSEGELYYKLGINGALDDINQMIESNSSLSESAYGVTVDYEVKRYPYREPNLEAIKKLILFDESKTFEELIEYRKEMIKTLEEKKKELQSELEEAKIEYKEKRKREEDDENRKKLEEEKKLKEINQWIETYGSERLKLLKENSYDIEKIYIEERVREEIPGFYVDTNNYIDIEYFNEYIPTLYELKKLKEYKEKGFNASIVRLSDYPFQMDYNGKDKATAIEISNIFNSGYNAYKNVIEYEVVID